MTPKIPGPSKSDASNEAGKIIAVVAVRSEDDQNQPEAPAELIVSGDGSGKPPKRYWRAVEPFLDLKLSHCGQIAFSFALTFVGVAQLIVYSRQAEIMQGQLVQARADALVTQTQLRAWMIAQPAGTDCHFAMDSAGHLLCDIAISNIGQTPAFQMRHKVGGGGFPFPLPDNLDLPIPSKDEVEKAATTNVALPHIPIFDHWSTKDKFTPGAFDEIAAPTGKRFYVYGRIDYRDVFNVEQCTTFCVSWTGKESQRMEFCPRYNDVCQSGKVP